MRELTQQRNEDIRNTVSVLENLLLQEYDNVSEKTRSRVGLSKKQEKKIRKKILNLIDQIK
jgi:hypothetical protein